MSITLGFLLPALLILLFCWLNRHLDAPDDQVHELRQPGPMRGMFLFSVIAFAVIAIGLPLTTGETEYSPYLAFLALMASLLSPFAFISGIRYGDSGLTIRTFFGRVHALRWEDVTIVRPGSPDQGRNRQRQDGWIIAAGRRFYVNYSIPGAASFICRAQQECRSRGVDPTPPRKKDDLFHGNVRNAGAILFGWWFGGILIAFIGVAWAILCLLNPESNPDDWFMVPVCAGVLIWWILHCLRGVQIGRAPEKYGKKAFESYFGQGSWPE